MKDSGEVVGRATSLASRHVAAKIRGIVNGYSTFFVFFSLAKKKKLANSLLTHACCYILFTFVFGSTSLLAPDIVHSLVKMSGFEAVGVLLGILPTLTKIFAFRDRIYLTPSTKLDVRRTMGSIADSLQWLEQQATISDNSSVLRFLWDHRVIESLTTEWQTLTKEWERLFNRNRFLTAFTIRKE